jgi:leader peptidase (prepilin peptidase)/N-methyltransferase
MIWNAVAIVLAPFVASFLGVVALRASQRRAWIWGRSACDSCESPLSARDLIPVVSWVALSGRCRKCGARLSAYYPALEFGAILVALWAVVVVPPNLLLATLALGFLLLTLAVIDWRAKRLPDVLTFTLGLLGLLASYLYDPSFVHWHVLAALAGFSFLALVSTVYRFMRHRDGLGLGDAKLLGAIGAWVSLGGLPSVLFGGAILAMGFVAIRTALHRGDWHTPVPFGPFLALAGWLVWLYGPLVPS